jgi:predicted nucleic acid-binding protein
MSRKVLVDASVFITLAEIDATHLLDKLDGDVVVPEQVADEIEDEPARSQLEDAEEDWLTVESADDETVEWASKRLGRNEPRGGTALLALASDVDGAVVVTDDEPLRNACKAVGVPLSGSLGVVVASVEKGTLEADEAKRLLVSMDEVGARLSARLLRKAESLIDEADAS